MPRRLSAGEGERAPESIGSPGNSPVLASLVKPRKGHIWIELTIASCSFSSTKCKSDGVMGLG